MGTRCYRDIDMTYFTFRGTLGLKCGRKHIFVKPYHLYLIYFDRSSRNIIMMVGQWTIADSVYRVLTNEKLKVHAVKPY